MLSCPGHPYKRDLRPRIGGRNDSRLAATIPCTNEEEESQHERYTASRPHSSHTIRTGRLLGNDLGLHRNSGERGQLRRIRWAHRCSTRNTLCNRGSGQQIGRSSTLVYRETQDRRCRPDGRGSPCHPGATRRKRRRFPGEPASCRKGQLRTPCGRDNKGPKRWRPIHSQTATPI